MALDTLEIFGDEYTNVRGFKATDDNGDTLAYIRPQGTKQITANGNGIDVSEYASVDVDVSAPAPQTQTKSVTPTESAQTVTPDAGYLLSQVDVGAINSSYVGSGVARKSTLNVSGKTVTAQAGYYAQDVSETVPVALQSKSVAPTESAQTITADAGNDGLSSVEVGAISSSYVGSGVTRRSSSDLTASGATVTVPSGYYSQQATKSVSTTSHPDPTATVNSSTGLVTASHTQTAGYVSAGTTTGTLQLTTQAATTITPATTPQTAVAAGRYTTGSVTVGAIPSQYIVPSGSQTITENGTVDVTSLAQIVVAVPIQHYYAGSAAPSASLGVDGDIYLQT